MAGRDRSVIVFTVAVVLGTVLIAHRIIYSSRLTVLENFNKQINQATEVNGLAHEALALSREVEQYKKRLPKEASIGWIFNKIEFIAEGSGVKVSSIVPDETRE